MRYDVICYMFILGFLAHRVSDLALQPKSWALNKSVPGRKGFTICTIHVLVYTTCIICSWQKFDILVYASVFIPHWIIDRYSLANKWLGLIRGRTFASAFASTDKYREFDVAFTCIVYKDVDETFHLVCLLLTILWFFR